MKLCLKVWHKKGFEKLKKRFLKNPSVNSIFILSTVFQQHIFKACADYGVYQISLGEDTQQTQTSFLQCFSNTFWKFQISPTHVQFQFVAVSPGYYFVQLVWNSKWWSENRCAKVEKTVAKESTAHILIWNRNMK